MATEATNNNESDRLSNSSPTSPFIYFRAQGSNANKADVDITITESNGKLIFNFVVVNQKNNPAALHSIHFDIYQVLLMIIGAPSHASRLT